MYSILLVEKNKEYAKKMQAALNEKTNEVTHVRSSIEGVAKLAQDPYEGLIIGCETLSDEDVLMIKTVQNLKPQIKSFVLAEQLPTEIELMAIKENVQFCMLKERALEVFIAYMDKEMENALVVGKVVDKEKLISQRDQLVIDQMARKVYKEGQEIKVSQKEYEILRMLLSNKEEVLSREDIVKNIWDVGIEDIHPRAIDGHIKRLRAKTDLQGIKTVRGHGYKWSENA